MKENRGAVQGKRGVAKSPVTAAVLTNCDPMYEDK